jgi:hypothetical protein
MKENETMMKHVHNFKSLSNGQKLDEGWKHSAHFDAKHATFLLEFSCFHARSALTLQTLITYLNTRKKFIEKFQQ